MSDRDAAPWFEALRRGEIKMQKCEACDTWRWPPRAMCNQCASFSGEWKPISAKGKVASWFVNHHRFSPVFPVPYTVVLARLDEQADLLVPGPFSGDPGGLRVGLPLRGNISPDPIELENDSERPPFIVWSAAGESTHE